MAKFDLETLLKYVNQWVGLNSDRSKIIASSSSIIGVHKKLKKLKVRDAIITYVMPPDQYLAPLCQF